MAYIKSLICEGFKSFKHRTRINFSKGFTSIVGANGSGKSNILDAFVFALGELSGNKLRVNNVRDLICNGGSNGGKPSSWARVDVVFNNSDRRIGFNSDTVKISRKVNLKGEGRYYINDKVTTRRNLQDLLDLGGLIPNSSNLILQGELFRIINMNHNERRGLIEEISGIAFYNEKKRAAEKDLNLVEENISRITLLLNEVSIQLDSIEQEKNDALKYQEHDIRQKNAEKATIVLRINELDAQVKKIKCKKDSLEKEIEEINETIINERESLMKCTIRLDEVKDKIRALQSSELKKLALELDEIKTELTKKETQAENHEKEIKILKKRLIAQFKKKDEMEIKKGSIQQDLDAKKQMKSEFKENLEDLKEQLYHCEEQVKEFDTEHAGFQDVLKTIDKELKAKYMVQNEISTEIKVRNTEQKSIQKTLNQAIIKAKRLETEIKDLKRALGELNTREANSKQVSNENINIDELEEEKKEINKRLRILQKHITEKQGKLIATRSKIKAVKKLTNNKAVDAILKLKQSTGDFNNTINGKIYGTIAQLGKTDDKYRTALEITGGARFNFIVVDNQQTAKKCINHLKTNKLGRASFIPLNEIRVNNFNLNLKLNEKVIGRAVDLIHFDPIFEKAFEFVFGRTVVVSDIDVATSLQINARRVTLEGDIVESSNLMSGGNNNKGRRGGFGTLEETKVPLLENELNSLIMKEKKYIQNLKTIESRITSSYKERISANKTISTIRQDIAVKQDKLESKENEIKELREQIENLKGEKTRIEKQITLKQENLSKINNVIKDLKNKERETESKISMLNNNDFTKKVTALRKQIDKLEKVRMKIKLEITRSETQLEEIITNRESELVNNIKACQEEIQIKTNELNALNDDLVVSRKEKERIETQFSEKDQIIKEFYHERDEFLREQTSLKVKIEDLKSTIHPKNIRINTLIVNLRNIESQKEETLNSVEITEEDLASIQEFLTMSQGKLNSIIIECKEVKHQLEPVNMRAIKRFGKIKTRYDDLIDKHDIVVNERQAIMEFIEKVEMEKKNTFLDAFNGINDNFKEIFSKLSPGGEAKLMLENEEDPFAGGVKMLARPGGKKWCLTQAMSGGEKTLTVVALVLGIQMHVPSPYYILDEIDAAFDDYNAGQVASMIKELSEKSQFILITHRDVTMTKTDQLLGVSNVHGLTSILNLNMRDALEQVAQF